MDSEDEKSNIKIKKIYHKIQLKVKKCNRKMNKNKKNKMMYILFKNR